jgi:hypothetical protein
MFENLAFIVDYGETPPKVPGNSNFTWEKNAESRVSVESRTKSPSIC